MHRVQISFDFLAIVVFVFILFLGMFEVYAIEVSSAMIMEGRTSALRVGSSVTRTINEILKENGTSALVTIPESLDTGEAYYFIIRASGRRVDIFWPISTQNKSISVPILTDNITAFNISKTAGSNQTFLNITNINGLVNVSLAVICGDGICDFDHGEKCYNCRTDCGCVLPNIHCCAEGTISEGECVQMPGTCG